MSQEAKGVTRQGLKDALDDSYVRGARIFQIALVVGVLMLGGITVALQWVLDDGGVIAEDSAEMDSVDPAPSDPLLEEPEVSDEEIEPDAVLVLSIVHATWFILAVVLGQFLYHRPGSLEKRARAMERQGLSKTGDPNRRAADGLRGLKILRMALLEGAAMLGLVTCILALVLGQMGAQPLYWLNGISALYVVAFGLATLPDRESMLEELVERAK